MSRAIMSRAIVSPETRGHQLGPAGPGGQLEVFRR